MSDSSEHEAEDGSREGDEDGDTAPEESSSL